jgi:serine acetyltransferase
MRFAFAYVFAFLPMPMKRIVARWIDKWDIHPTAHIGPSVLTVRHLSMGSGVSIGGRNVITNLNELRMGEGATIGSGNMVKGWWDHPTDALTERNPAVFLGDHAQIAS